MFEKLKQFKDLRDKAKTIQGALAQVTVEGAGAWNKVKVTMDGNMAASAVSIDPSLLVASEKTALENGIKDAVNDAVKKAQKEAMEKMKSVGGLDFPGMK
jgi:DNA-binding YbaB/EbfC family protein